MNELTPKEFDLEFVLRDCNGDIKAAQRRVDRALAEREKRGVLRASSVAFKAWQNEVATQDIVLKILAEADKVGK